MVFRGPNYLKTALLSHLYHFKCVAGHVFHVETAVQTLQIYSQLKFHLNYPLFGITVHLQNFEVGLNPILAITALQMGLTLVRQTYSSKLFWA